MYVWVIDPQPQNLVAAAVFETQCVLSVTKCIAQADSIVPGNIRSCRYSQGFFGDGVSNDSELSEVLQS